MWHSLCVSHQLKLSMTKSKPCHPFFLTCHSSLYSLPHFSIIAENVWSVLLALPTFDFSHLLLVSSLLLKPVTPLLHIQNVCVPFHLYCHSPCACLKGDFRKIKQNKTGFVPFLLLYWWMAWILRTAPHLPHQKTSFCFLNLEISGMSSMISLVFFSGRP